MIALVAAAAVMSSASVGAAQEKKEVRKEPGKVRVTSPRCVVNDDEVDCSTFRFADMDSVLKKRAALGIQLSSTGSLRDTIGVFIARVTPKGPAETAGVFEGERIVSINGVDLRLNAADAGDSYASGLATRRLTREVQKLAPGARVNLRVWSGGRVRDVQVTAGSAYDLRERGGLLGFFGEGMPGAFTWGDGPSHIRMRSFPRMRMEGMPKVRIEQMPRFDFDFDGGPFIYREKKSDKQVKEPEKKEKPVSM
ncbi:MAG TPA: PDZ domain-containing protein [Gemmatimonadaceae bacterium]|nr:PDZ domain-containing protein [Gemmatimonadaceae bacterium]